MPLAPADHLAARFTPFPVRARADGWTEERQRGFVRALTRGATVTEAAAAVGMSRESAYRLAARKHARSFRRAWRVAGELGRPLPPDRENLWGSHVVDRRKCGLARKPVSDGRLRCALRNALTRVERQTRERHDRLLPDIEARESYNGGEELADRCETFVTFRARSIPPTTARPQVGRGRTPNGRDRPDTPAGRWLIRPPPCPDAGRGAP